MKSINLRYSTSLVLFFCISLISRAQYSDIDTDGLGYGENCTTIMVGRLASTDGSVMTSHTCDGNYRTWLEIFPRQKYVKGAAHQVYEGMLIWQSALRWLIRKKYGSSKLQVPEKVNLQQSGVPNEYLTKT